MTKVLSLNDLIIMSPASRRILYKNAAAVDSDQAREIVRLIADNRLLVTQSGGLPHEDPVILEIESIAESTEGRAAAKKATDDGLPAMAGVDPLLHAALGDQYGQFDTTNWAGIFVAQQMESMGYVQVCKKKMPVGMVAKTAAYFKKR